MSASVTYMIIMWKNLCGLACRKSAQLVICVDEGTRQLPKDSCVPVSVCDSHGWASQAHVLVGIRYSKGPLSRVLAIFF